jgi:hypothetical protein|tara:strand:- start:1837 stop:2067 length:231 start_codon:yes stop_codon:yes gene_type:complete
MHRLKGLILILIGLSLIGTGIALTIAWIGFCFGTLVIGVLLLIFSPAILIAPFAIFSLPGWGLVEKGTLVFKRIII